MAKEFSSLVAWLTSESADDDVAPRQITIQVAVEDDEHPEAPTGLVAIASVGGEDYIAGEPSDDDLVAALDSLDDELIAEAARLTGADLPGEEDGDADEQDEDEDSDDEDEDDDE